MKSPTMRYQCFYLLGLFLIASTAQAQTPALDIKDNKGTPLFQVYTDGTLRLPVGAAAGYVLTSDASGNAAWKNAGSGGLSLPYAGTYNQVQSAFSLTKNGPGELLALSKTGEGQALFISAGGGSVGDFAARINGSFGGITTQAGNGVGINATNNSTSPTLQVSNGGSGVAGRFEGDVEVTGGLTCTGCIDGTDVGDSSLTGADVQNGSLTAVDVDQSSGFYVSKTQLYIETVTFNISNNSIGDGEAACRDNNDLPLSGACFGPVAQSTSLRSTRHIDWLTNDAPAQYECTHTNNTGAVAEYQVTIVCLDVN